MEPTKEFLLSQLEAYKQEITKRMGVVEFIGALLEKKVYVESKAIPTNGPETPDNLPKE